MLLAVCVLACNDGRQDERSWWLGSSETNNFVHTLKLTCKRRMTDFSHYGSDSLTEINVPFLQWLADGNNLGWETPLCNEVAKTIIHA